MFFVLIPLGGISTAVSTSIFQKRNSDSNTRGLKKFKLILAVVSGGLVYTITLVILWYMGRHKQYVMKKELSSTTTEDFFTCNLALGSKVPYNFSNSHSFEEMIGNPTFWLTIGM